MNPLAFALLFVIASRAQRLQRFNRYGLKPGEALIGDHKSYGMSRQNYRTAIALLDKLGFSTFKPTTSGTIATLTDTRIFDPNIEYANHQPNHHPTIDQPSTNHYQEVKKEKMAENLNNQRVSLAIPSDEDEVFDYAKSIGYEDDVSIQSFINHNNSKGWIMQDWKLGFDGWCREYPDFK